MQDIVFYAAANETLGMVRDYTNMHQEEAPALTIGVAVCLRMRLFAGIKDPTPYPAASLSGITDWHWSMDSDFDRSTACKLAADEGGISVHTVTDTVNGETMSFTEFVIPVSGMNTEELAAWLGNAGTKSGLTGELVGYDNEGYAVFVLQIENFKVRNRVAGLADPAAVDEGFVTRTSAEHMIQAAVSDSAATKQDILTAGAGIDITGGTEISIDLAAGERMEIVSGNTIGQKRYFPITTITGNTVTLTAGRACRLNATTGTKTLYAENMDDDTFGLEGHIEIFVANTGNVQTGMLAGGTTEVILADALEPDAVNNCTVRFHDHKAIISVEDHVAGHIVKVSAGTAANSLHYWLTQPNTASDAAAQYIGFDASLNGTPVNFEGAANTAVKHVVGNGYAQTILTGKVAPAAALTVSDLGLQDVTVTSGTLTLGDACIPSGSTVTVSSGGSLAIEKVTGNGGTIEHGRSIVSATVASAASVTCLSCGVDNNSNINGGAFCISSGGSLYASGVTFDACSSTRGGAVYMNDSACKATLVGCSAVNCYANAGRAMAFYGGSGILTDCYFSGNRTADNVGAIILRRAVLDVSGCSFDDDKICIANASSSTLNLIGSNHFSGTVTGDPNCSTILTSGATIDLTGNTNTTPIKPGGGVTIPAGAIVNVIGSGGTSGPCGYFSDLAITGTTITNLGRILGATVTVPAIGEPIASAGPWDLITDSGTRTVSAAAQAQVIDDIAGGLYQVIGQ